MTISKSANLTATPARLSAKLNKGLVSYVAAATAAGVGILATSQPSEGEVVYTPANVPLVINTPVSLDLNNDGIADFQLSNHYFAAIGKSCTVCSFFEQALLKVTHDQTANAAWAMTSTVVSHIGAVRKNKNKNKKEKGTGAQVDVAAPAFEGVVVNAGRKFRAGILVMDSVDASQTIFGFYSTKSVGAWGKGQQFTGPYLGLRFRVGGEVHFGWARIEVHAKGLAITATLTGYAYETIPNRGIITGVTHGTFVESAQITATPNNSTSAASASLGRLAQGASGLPVWRLARAAAPASGE